MNKRKFTKYIILLIGLIFIICIVGYFIYENVNNDRIKIMNLEFQSRIEEINNFDSGDYTTVGWLQVQGTNIDFPIVESFLTEIEPKFDYGWQSPNYVKGGNREVLLGHNILNVSSTPMLSNENLKNFESLMSFVYPEFAKDNLYIQYTKDGKDEVYLIYAIGFFQTGYDYAQSMSDKVKIKNYINKVRKNSIYNYDIDVNENDSLIAVKTCTRYFGSNDKQQFVIEARKLRDDEKIVKYKVSTSKQFSKIFNNSENS